MKNKCIILFVDDYVGSGKTAVKCGEILLNEIGKSTRQERTDDFVLSKDGLDVLGIIQNGKLKSK